MNQSKAEAIVARLLVNAAGLRYGSVAVTAKVHDGRVVEVLYATTECIRDEMREKTDTSLNGVR
jgi:hypothetical protein